MMSAWGWPTSETFWLVWGLGFQSMFMCRFVVQWIATERHQRTMIPRAFWVLSLLGGAGTLIYALHRRDPVFILGQTLGLGIYARNLQIAIRSADSVVQRGPA